MSSSECGKQFGFSSRAWKLAKRRGDIIPLGIRPKRKFSPITDPRECCKCHSLKPLSDFHTLSKNGRPSYCCKDCQREYNRGHYNSNTQYYVDKAGRHSKEYKERAYLMLYEYYLENPCVDCGESSPIKLQFDHVRDSKLASVSVLVQRGASLERIADEISKCDVRCANCHMVRTAKSRNWKWVEFLMSRGIKV